MGGGRSNEEAKWQRPLASDASASLRSGEWGLLAQHLLAGLRYTHPPKPHSHPCHGTIVTGFLGFAEVGLEHPNSCMGGGRSNEEAKLHRPLASDASASLRSGEWGLLAQHLLSDLLYIYIYILYRGANYGGARGSSPSLNKTWAPLKTWFVKFWGSQKRLTKCYFDVQFKFCVMWSSLISMCKIATTINSLIHAWQRFKSNSLQ